MIKPLADRIVIKVIDDVQQTSGGIFIPDSAKEKPQKGEVVAVGSGKTLDSGEKEPIEVKVGDVVLFAKYSGTDVKVDDVVRALKEGDDDLLAASIGNSLEDAAIKLVPEIQQIKQTLLSRGFKIVLMSGSGSTVFALSTDSSLVKKVAKELDDHYFVEISKVINK